MLNVTYAGGTYDRTQALKTGEIRPDRLHLTYLSPPVEDIFWRQMRYQEYDCSELSLSSLSISQDRKSHDLVAIPIFPSRHFRLSCIYVREDSPLTRLEELAGKRVGHPEYQMTAAVWQRGIFAEHFDVPWQSVQWFTGRPERVDVDLPSNVTVYRGEGGLAAGVIRGELDALMAARMPEQYVRRKGLRRLLQDSRAAEVAYYQKTGIFPIMHTVAIKGELLRSNPWLAYSLYDAFARAKELALTTMYESTAHQFTLPWVAETLEEVRSLLGNDFWPYGFRSNRATVDKMLAYMHDQGLTAKRLEPEALFDPGLLDT